jgi:hypothetical protein
MQPPLQISTETSGGESETHQTDSLVVLAERTCNAQHKPQTTITVLGSDCIAGLPTAAAQPALALASAIDTKVNRKLCENSALSNTREATHQERKTHRFVQLHW